jgi:hypothetical protein
MNCSELDVAVVLLDHRCSEFHGRADGQAHLASPGADSLRKPTQRTAAHASLPPAGPCRGQARRRSNVFSENRTRGRARARHCEASNVPLS